MARANEWTSSSFANARRSWITFLNLNCLVTKKKNFTGAVPDASENWEANGGTLLLDEISEMDIRLQAKLLRAIRNVMIRLSAISPSA